MEQRHGWDKRIKLLRISSIAIVVSLILLLLFAWFTFYGSRVGSFVIRIDGSNNIQLALSKREDLSDAASRIVVDSLDGQSDGTYDDVDRNIAKSAVGAKNDASRRYMAFSFYLLNRTTHAIDYTMSIDVLEVTGDLISILRVMIIEDDNPKEENTIYAVPEATLEDQRLLEESFRIYQNTFYATEDILPTDGQYTKIMEKNVLDFEGGGKKKYTVVMWLEGNDPQCTDERLEEIIKMEMTFTGH
ncbi:MAG: hypothetical protein J6Z36_01165 [Clostridia bacterium]|nr:hypothetical protein [Clostridia bacterium]